MTRKNAKNFLKALPGESAIMSLMRLRNEGGHDAFMIGLTCEPDGAGVMSHAAVLSVQESLEEQFADLRRDFLDARGGVAGPAKEEDPRLAVEEEASSVAKWWNRKRFSEVWTAKLSGRGWEELSGEEQESVRELYLGE